jgi:hypothetical protein
MHKRDEEANAGRPADGLRSRERLREQRTRESQKPPALKSAQGPPG